MEGRERERRRAAWRLLGRLIVWERRGVAGGILSGLTWQGAAITTPVFAAFAIDALRSDDRHGVYLWAGLAALIGVVEAAGGVGRHVFAMRNRAHALARVRDLLLRHSLRLDARFHDRFPPGELMSRSSSDAELISRMLDSMGHTAGYVVTVIGASAVLIVFDWRLALVVLAPLPLLSFAFWRYARRYVARTHALQEELGHTSALVEESVTGIRVVKGLGAGEAMSQRFRAVSDRVYDRSMDVARLDAVFLPALEPVPLLDQLLVLWLGGHRVLDGKLTVGEFVAFNAFVVMLIWPVRVLGQRISTLQNAVAASERVVEALEVEPKVREPEHPRPLAGRGDVRFEDVVFGYSEGEPLLDGLNLRIEPGDSVALVGRTGSGKSTIAALLVRFYDVDRGAVYLDDVDIREASLVDLRRNVALVSEETYLFTETVRTNIAYGRPDATDEEVVAAAEADGAHEFVSELPDGYETMLGERGYTLSGGQRQRIAIARAILADPAVLVLDDATSSVDATKEHEIRGALATVMEGRTTIVIAHRPATIALAARVAVLENGRIVEEGRHAELAARSERYRALLAIDEEAAA